MMNELVGPWQRQMTSLFSFPFSLAMVVGRSRNHIQILFLSSVYELSRVEVLEGKLVIKISIPYILTAS